MIFRSKKTMGTLLGKVEKNGAGRWEFVPADPSAHSLALAKLGHKGKPVEADYKSVFGKRSRRQGSAWHGIVVPIWMDCYGLLNHDEAHYSLLKEIHYEINIDIKGREHRQAKPTRTLDTAQSNALYKKAQDFIAIEYGVDVPDPDPNWKGFGA